MKITAFFKECREKEVFKKLSIYAVSSWLLIQVLPVVWEPLGLPFATVTILLILLLVGFPIYMFYIWKYQIQPIHLEVEAKKRMQTEDAMEGMMSFMQRREAKVKDR